MMILLLLLRVSMALIHLYSVLTPDFDGIRGSNDNAYIKNGVYSLSELSMSKFLGVRKHLTSSTFVLLFLSFPMTILFVCTCRVQFKIN